MTMAGRNIENPPGAATPKGVNAIADGAYASGSSYTNPEGFDKGQQTAGEVQGIAHSTRARANGDSDKRNDVKAAYQAPDGRTWRYKGKKARVLMQLAQNANGVTQWDTLPWHTRLGGTIHAMRCDGLEISTELEGDCRHARYRLHTRGSLIIQPITGRESVIIHRVTP